MAYSRYKTKIVKQEIYFHNWSSKDLEKMHNHYKDLLYKKYLVKHKVYNRDKFKCQNILCKTPKSKLSLHRIKFGKNGGKYKEDNCITMCVACQGKFHKGYMKLQLSKSKNIPAKFRGHTFNVTKLQRNKWRGFIIEYKSLRKRIRITISRKKVTNIIAKLKIVSKYLKLRVLELAS
jgi:hypothetical protein